MGTVTGGGQVRQCNERSNGRRINHSGNLSMKEFSKKKIYGKQRVVEKKLRKCSGYFCSKQLKSFRQKKMLFFASDIT